MSVSKRRSELATSELALHLEGPPPQGAAAGTARRPGRRAPIAATAPRWTLYHSNHASWAAAKQLVDGARDSIAIEQYIFSPDGIGKEILDILTHKARRGVKVRIIADAFGSQGLLKSEPARALMAAGGEIAIFNGVRQFFRNPGSAFHRLHRKSIICDGRRLMTGGSCFLPRMADWRDTMVTVEGPVAGQALLDFETTWERALEADPRSSDVDSPPPDQPRQEWSYMVSSPYGPFKREYYLEFMERIAEAKQLVTLTTPYLIPVGRFWTVMESAARRGVRVRVMIPRKSDHPLIDLFSFSFARVLIERGIEVYGYAAGMMHAKLAVIDGSWSAVGSFNLGIDSFRMNLEGVLVSRSAAFHEALTEQLERDLALSHRL
jgi:cardiolipin synthase